MNNDNFGYTLGNLNSLKIDQTFNFGRINNILLTLKNNINKGVRPEPKKNKNKLPTVEDYLF